MELRIPLEYISAAKLIDPAAQGQIEFNQDVDWSAVLRVLIKNKVPLTSVEKSPSFNTCPLQQDYEFNKCIRAEKLMAGVIRDEYGELRQALLQRGIKCILLKSPGLFPSFPYTSDNLDVLVHPEDVVQSRETLTNLGYVELLNIEEPQKWLFRKYVGSESVSAIHLHGGVVWGVPFLDDAVLWSRAHLTDDDPWVMVPSPEDALLITIAHAIYENKSLKLLDIVRIRFCLLTCNLDVSQMKKLAEDYGWEDGLAFFLCVYNQLETTLYQDTQIPEKVLDWAKSVISANIWLSWQLEKTLNRDQIMFPFRVAFLTGKVLYYKKILNDQKRNRITQMRDIFSTLLWGIKLKLGINGQRGMIVSFCGIDGAGKTVHAQALARAFGTSAIRADVYWSRFGSSIQKDHVSIPKSPIPPPYNFAGSLAHRRQRLSNPLIQSGWLAINLGIYFLQCAWNVGIPRLFGHVVICDRYIYSTIVEINASLPDGSRLSRWAEWLLIHLWPHPDVAWLMDASADDSTNRQLENKGDEDSCKELSLQRSNFKSLATTYNMKVLITNSNLDETSTMVVRETLNKYYENYHTWINAIFLSDSIHMNPQQGRKVMQ